MDPAQRQQVMLILEAEQLLHVLHVAEIRAGGLFGDHDMSQRELVVRLRMRERRGLAGGIQLKTGEGVTGRAFHLPAVHRGRRRSRFLWSCSTGPARGNSESALWESGPASGPPLSHLYTNTPGLRERNVCVEVRLNLLHCI